MSVKKEYSCDLCNRLYLKDSDGIGIYHHADGKISAKYLHSEGCGHHLCNACIKGLRLMLEDMDRLSAIEAERDGGDT